MIDKSLIKKRFQKSLSTYDDNAFIQKKMAEKLISLLPRKNFSSIFEIGCSTGVLTKEISKNFTFQTYTANDIVEQSKDYINKIIPQNNFVIGDIEKLEIKQKYDLIIANAVLQWCENPEKTIEKLKLCIKPNGIIAVSVFAKDNFYEIKNVLNIQPKSNDLSGITEEHILLFNTPVDVLKHIKATGANAITEYKFTKSSLNAFSTKYKDLYEINGKVHLTYKPLYKVICL